MIKFVATVLACLLGSAVADHYVGGWDPRFCCYPPTEECCPTDPVDPCPTCVDMAVIIDVSSTVGSVAYENELIPFVIAIANDGPWTLGSGSDEYQVSLTRFSTSASIMVNWGDPASQDSAIFTPFVESFEYGIGGLTDTGEALQLTREQILEGPNNRPDCADVCIVITDGDVNPGTHTERFNEQIGPFKAACDKIIAVGVTSSVPQSRLDTIAEPADFTIAVEDFNSLAGILPQIEDLICPDSPPTDCPDCADVSIIVDMSSSVGLQNWEQYQSVFLENFATTSEWTVTDGSSPTDGFQLSLITFSTAAQLQANWGDAASSSSAAFVSLVDSISYTGGLTDMGEAMQLAREQVITGPNNRPGCADFCIFITDGAYNPGQHTDNFNAQFPLYRDACQTLIVVAIRLSSVDMTKLDAFIASAEASVFVDEFDQLIPVFDSVIEALCPPPPPPEGCCLYDYPTYYEVLRRY